MLTEQEVFDKVVERLMDGTGQAIDDQYGCLYLNDDGLKCAVGIFLPENKDMQSYEGNAYDLVRAFGDHPDFPEEIVKYKTLMHDLQRVHDVRYNWKGKKFIGLEVRLEDVAEKHGLEYERTEDVN